MKTRVSKSGQPVLGTTIEVRLQDQTWIPVKVAGKFFGKGGNADLIGVVIEEIEEPYKGQRETLDWVDCCNRGSWRRLTNA